MYHIDTYHFAASIEEALDILKKNPQNRILAGGTWLRLGEPHIPVAIDLSRLGLDRIETAADCITIGAMTPLRELETDACLKEEFGGVLPQAVSSIVGVQFRQMATVGASVYSRFGFSDVITALLALDCQVTLAEHGTMTLESFLNHRPKRDILLSIQIQRDGRSASYQTLRRSKTDFGILNVCVARTVDHHHVISVGARPHVACRCPEAEAFLNAGNLAQAAAAIAQLPMGTNMRASADYRRAIAGVLLERAVTQ